MQLPDASDCVILPAAISLILTMNILKEEGALHFKRIIKG
jgi:hypothetical protein